MVELKFRAWDKDKKQMCLVSDISFGDDGRALTIIFQTSPKGQYYRGLVHGESGFLMQWTGIKDASGKDIYEGDIVKTENEQYGSYPCPDSYQGIVTYLEDSYHIVQSHRTYKPTLRNLTIMSIEVIGNVYEHPELLEVVEP